MRVNCNTNDSMVKRNGEIPPTGTLPDYPFLFGNWRALDSHEWGTIIILAVLIVSVIIGLAKAYQSPKPQVIATFDDSYLIFAAFWCC